MPTEDNRCPFVLVDSITVFRYVFVLDHSQSPLRQSKGQFEPAGLCMRLQARYLINAMAIHQALATLTGPHVFLHAAISSSNCLSQLLGSFVGKFGGVVTIGFVSVQGLKSPCPKSGRRAPEPEDEFGSGTGTGIPPGPTMTPANPKGSICDSGFPPT